MKFQWAKLAATISDYSTFLDATRQSIMGAGSTMDYAAVQLETLSKKVEILKQHLVGLSVATGNGGLSDTLKLVTDTAINLVSGFEHMNSSTIILLGSLSGLVLILPKIVTVVKEITVATKTLTATQAVLTVLQGNLAGLLAGGIVAGLGLYAINAGEAEEQQRKLNQAIEEAAKTAPQIADGYIRSASFIRETAKDIQTIEAEISKAQAEGNQERVEKLKEYLATAKRVIAETAGYDLSKNLENNNYSSKAIESAAKALEEKGKITSLMVEAGQGEEVAIADLTEKYVGLRKEINSNTLDEKELIKKKIQLHDITEKLTTLVPSLADGFDKNGNSVLKFDGILNDNSKTLQDYIKIVKEYMAVDLEQRISKQQSVLDASQKKMKDAEKYLAFIQKQSGVVKIYGKDTISQEDLKKATEEVSNATREYQKQQLALQGLELQKESLLTSTKALNDAESKKFIGAGDNGKIIAQGQEMISLTKEQTSQVKVLNQAEYELAKNGEISGTTTQKLIKINENYRDIIAQGKDAILEKIKVDKQATTEGINNQIKLTRQAIESTRTRIRLLIIEQEAQNEINKLHSEMENTTNDQVAAIKAQEVMKIIKEQQEKFAGNKSALEPLNKELQELEDVYSQLSNIKEGMLKNDKLINEQNKEATQIAKDREKAEREAAKAAEEARKRELDQLKEIESHYQKMFDLKKRMHELSIDTEEYAYSRMKKDSKEARDHLQKIIDLRKEGLAIDATEAKRLESSANTFEIAAKNEASIAAQNRYGISPTDTSGNFKGAHASLVNKYAKSNGVNPILSGAVMMQESNGKGNNVMQVNGMNGASVEASIKKGNEMLGKLLVKTNGNIEKALAAYNMGEGILKFFDENGGYSRENMKKFSDMQKKKYGYKVYGDPDYIQHVFNRLPQSSKSTTTTVNRGVNTTGDASDFVKLKSNYVKGPTNINPHLLSLLEALAKDKDKTINLTSGGRTKAQQEDLKRRKPHLAAKAGYSKHEYGLAVDVADQWLKNMSEAELAKYGLHKPALKSKGENWHIEPLETKGVRNPADIKKLSITLATGGGTTTTDVPLDLSKDYQGQADDNYSKAFELKSRRISEQQLIDEAEQKKVESWLAYYDNELAKKEQLIKDSQIKMNNLDQTSAEYRKELQNQIKLEKEKQNIYHQNADYIRSIEADAKKNKDLYSGDFLEELRKKREQLGQSWKESANEINSISYEKVKNELAELSEETEQYDRQLRISKASMDLYKEDSAEYHNELKKQTDILNQKINIERQTQKVIESNLKLQGLSINQIEDLNKQKDESIQREREYQVEIKRTRQILYNQIADNLGKLRDKDIEMLEEKRDKAIEDLEKEINSQNEAYDRRIQLRQEELDQLDEQYEKEERLKKLREIDDEIANVKADKRFSIINADGEETLTYNKERVSELQKQRDEILQQYQREDVKRVKQQEIDDLRRQKDEKERMLREELDNIKRKYDDEIKSEKEKWNQLIEGAKNGTLRFNELMNGKNGFYPTAISNLQEYRKQVQSEVNSIISAYERLGEMSVSSGSSDKKKKTGTSSAVGAATGAAIGGGIGGGLGSAIGGAIGAASGLKKYHDGGIVGGKGSRLAEIANKLFNTKPGEQTIISLLGELQVPPKNIMQNFIPNMQNLIASVSPNQPVAVQSGDTITLNNVTIKANNPMEFLDGLSHHIKTWRT